MQHATVVASLSLRVCPRTHYRCCLCLSVGLFYSTLHVLILLLCRSVVQHATCAACVCL